ncbi:fructose-6-phosphate 2-kinase fructose-6-biphosphatase [Lichtheimia corymbifera JMRC:FSU:9682]|uniref:Fructose-6-phosphate 2-kinase fructose-6-biphosphatase n=1 Tax=Lichtheimia corymbifera JMRC:FSU:9682 TaxID=1263082 RepID=A0A068RYT9_9FUNG|nr:fructose-6-phosphate 2-kinase fructose-6-biphosphatase [Lichtheimia corymbifera JMRC:FSU:9682]
MQMQQESSNNRNESSSAPTATPAIVPLSPCCTPTSSHSESTRWSETLNPDSQPQSSSIEEWGAFSSPTIDNCYLSARPEHIRAHGFDVPGAVQSIVTPKTSREPHSDSKLVIIMVGLPARGKSYIVKKLRRYLNWLQYETKVFNVGDLRRVNQESQQHEQSAGFFDPGNEEAKRIRDNLALEVLDHLINWLSEGGRVAIHDATNSTIERRFLLLNRLQEYPQIKVLLLESLCTDKKILERNFRLKLLGPDYRDKPAAEALADFKSRVSNYERAYQPVGEWEEKHDIQYCKLMNVGKKVVAYNISGYLSGQCVFYLMNFNLADRQIFLTRHGQSEDNVVGRIGGDAPLSARGRKYSKALARFIKEQRIAFALDSVKQQEEQEEYWASNGLEPLDDEPPLFRKKTISNQQQFTVWTSMLKRAMQTATWFDPDEYDIKHIRFLNEINAAVCEGMTYDEILEKYPGEFSARRANKLYYRYPGIGGESYLDVIHRTQSMIIELERMSESCLIITHRVVMRILMGYLLDRSREQMPHMDIPMHTLFEIRPKPYGNELRVWKYNEEEDVFEERTSCFKDK